MRRIKSPAKGDDRAAQRLAHRSARKRKRGSAILAVLITGVVMIFAVGGYLRVSLNQLAAADRSYLRLGLGNLIEAGVEEALWMLQTGDRTDWESSGAGVLSRVIDDWLLDGRLATEVRVEVEDRVEDVFVRVQVQGELRAGEVVERSAEVQFVRKSPFNFGLQAHELIRLSGNPIAMDSFDSRNGAYDSNVNRRDRITVISPASRAGAVDIGNASVFGRLAVNRAESFAKGPQGRVYGVNTASGERVDPNRFRTGVVLDRPFNAIVPKLENPQLWPGGNEIQMGDLTGFTVEDYSVDSIFIRANQSVRIRGLVRWFVAGDVDIRGSVIIEEDGQLEIFIKGDFLASGGSVVNESQRSENLRLYGVGGTGQEIMIAGNALFAGVVYAPHASLTISGGGQNGRFLGSAVVESFVVSGRYTYHFDEALRANTFNAPVYALARWNDFATVRLRYD